jgi:hypothetical protein
MFRLAADVQVYLHREAIDFRIGINGLAILVEQAMHLDPFRRAVFAFCNRRRDRIRLLFYDRSGFWLMNRALTRLADREADCRSRRRGTASVELADSPIGDRTNGRAGNGSHRRSPATLTTATR